MPGRTEETSGGVTRRPVLDDEEVLAAALGDVALRVEGDALGEAALAWPPS